MEENRGQDTSAPADTMISQLSSWLDKLPAVEPASWEQLPDIGLYMDQVLTYIDRQLALHRSSEKEHVVTSAMVNNYIKDGLLPRADLKKYAPGHLALLTLIGALKSVLSMQDLQILLGGRAADGQEGRSVPEAYAHFLTTQKAVVTETAAEVGRQLRALAATEPAAAAGAAEPVAAAGAAEPVGTARPAAAAVSDAAPAAEPAAEAASLSALRKIALDLAVEARVRILVAEQLLAAIARTERDLSARKAAAEAADKNGRKKPQKA